MHLPDFGFSPRNFFGLSIGKTALRGIELNNNKQVVSYAQASLDPSVLDGGVIQTAQFVEALKQLRAQGHFKSTFVAVTVPESYAYSREYTLPVANKDEIGEAVIWQIKDLFPFSPDEIYFDWKILKQEKENTTILVVAMPRTILDTMSTCIKEAGLHPVSFTPSSSILAPVMQLKDKEVALLLEINQKGSMATIVEHDVSFLTTTTSFPGGLSTESFTQVTFSLTQLLNYYKDKKRLSLDSIRIFVTGESANPQIVEQLGKVLGKQAILLTIPGIPPSYHKAYAASLMHHTRPEDATTINLLPKNLQELYDLENLYQHLRAKATVGLILFAFSIALSVLTFMTVLLQKGSLEKETEQINTQLTNAGFNRSQVGLINTQAGLITSLFPLKKTPKDTFEAIQKETPEGVAVTLWLFDAKERSIKLEGVAQKREDVLAFRQNLETLESFEKVYIPLSSLELPENIHFSITLTLKK